MKIIYIHQYFGTPSSTGGTRSYEMAKRLVQDGHEVHMITGSTKLADKCKNNDWNQFSVDGINVHVLDVPYSNKDSFIKRIGKFIEFSLRTLFYARKIKADIVFASSTPLTVSIPGIICARKNKAPFVFEVRDLWPEVPIVLGALKSPFSKSLARILEKWSYKNSDRIIALSQGMAEGVMQTGFPKEKICVIPNSSDLELFDISYEKIEQFKTSLPFLNGRKLAVYTGTLGIVNGADYIARLASATLQKGDDICYLLVGDGNQKEVVEKEAKKLGVLNKNLYIMPPVKKEEIVTIIKAADIAFSTVQPIKELYNNSANKVFDAFAAGTAVAINHGGWLADLLNANNAGIVLPHDDINIAAEKLITFLADNKKLNQASRNSHALAKNSFDRNILYRKLQSTLLSALKNKSYD